jgi:hypothetical protein
MLPFMQEHEQDNPPQGQADKTANSPMPNAQNLQEQPGPMKWEQAPEQPQQYLTAEAQRQQQARKTTYMLAVLFAAGMLCLWLMIKKTTPQAASASQSSAISAEEAHIEKAIEELTGVSSQMFNGLEKIVEKFYQFGDVQQVQVNELVKNPFEIDSFLGNLKYGIATADFDLGAEKNKTDVLWQQAQSLQLLGIMTAESGNCCVIDDQILYEGDSIRGFKVSKISDSFVKLESETTEWGPHSEQQSMGTQIILKLSE